MLFGFRASLGRGLGYIHGFPGLTAPGESSGLRTGGGSVDIVDDVGVDNVGCRLVLEKRGVRAAYRSSSERRETSWMAPNSRQDRGGASPFVPCVQTP